MWSEQRWGAILDYYIIIIYFFSPHSITPKSSYYCWADAIIQVPHTFIQVRKTKSSRPRTNILIQHQHYIHTSIDSISGPLSPETLEDLHKTITTRFHRIDGNTHSDDETNDAGSCDICTGTGKLIRFTRHSLHRMAPPPMCQPHIPTIS